MPPDKNDDSDLELAAALGEAGLDKSGASKAAGDPGKPLPKKVELDIDDMLLREIAPPEATPPPSAEPLPEPVEEEEAPVPAPGPAPKKPKFSKKKLLILGTAILLPAMLVFVAVIWFFFSEPKPTPEEQAAVLPKTVQMAPFIVNYPEAQPEIVVRVGITLTFTDTAAEALFQGRKIPVRDIVFRYLQGRGPNVARDPQASTVLSQGLLRLLEEHFAAGAVKSVEITQLEEV